MKLLLDSMYMPAIAEQLRRRGHDATSARADPDREDLSDLDIFAIAQAEGRVIVTENIPDFLKIEAAYRDQGQDHVGLILTTNHGYTRTRPSHIGRLVTALDAWLKDHPGDEPPASMIWWL
jgi:predicted nuclease of predicted toxin-antitoxin system